MANKAYNFLLSVMALSKSLMYYLLLETHIFLKSWVTLLNINLNLELMYICFNVIAG